MIKMYSPDVNMNYTGSAGMKPEVKTYYDKKMLMEVEPNLVHDQFATKRPLPQNEGQSVSFRRWDDLPKATAALTEGITPAGQSLSVSEITAHVHQFGAWVQLTDKLEMTSIDKVGSQTQERMAKQAVKSLDAITREVVVGGTNVLYVPAREGDTETPTLLREDITTKNKIKFADILDAVAVMRAHNVPTIGDSYVCIIHPFIERDLMDDPEWREWCKSQHAEKMFKGEIGEYGDCRFVVSSEAKIFAANGMFAPVVENYGDTTLYSQASGTTFYPAATLTEERAAAINSAISAGSQFNAYVDGKKYRIASVTGGPVGTTAITINPDLQVSEAATVSGAVGAKVMGGDAAKNGNSVFATMIVGEEAYALTELAGGGLEYIMKPLGYGNDPLNQRSAAGWKANRAVCRLNEAHMVRIESGCSKHPDAPAN